MIIHLKKIINSIFIRLTAFFKFKKTIDNYKINAILEKKFSEIKLDEASFLSALVRSTKSNGPIIEIGTQFGYSALIIAMNKRKSVKLITVDDYSWNSLGLPYDKYFDLTNKLLDNEIKNENVEQINIDKNIFYETYNGPTPALVFLDANHSYEETKKDIIWSKKVKAEIICGHDYCSDFPEVIQVVDEMGGYEKLVNSLWVLK